MRVLAKKTDKPLSVVIIIVFFFSLAVYYAYEATHSN